MCGSMQYYANHFIYVASILRFMLLFRSVVSLLSHGGRIGCASRHGDRRGKREGERGRSAPPVSDKGPLPRRSKPLPGSRGVSRYSCLSVSSFRKGERKRGKDRRTDGGREMEGEGESGTMPQPESPGFQSRTREKQQQQQQLQLLLNNNVKQHSHYNT